MNKYYSHTNILQIKKIYYNVIIAYEHINKYNLDESIFLEEIKQHVINKCKNNESNVLGNTDDIINRIFFIICCNSYILEF